jgi:D-sedoheptulose 7-phosphate isomerase
MRFLCVQRPATTQNSGTTKKPAAKAKKQAKEQGIKTIGLLGRDGGALAKSCDMSLVIPHQQTARIQEMHILIGHIVCHSVETHLGLV